MCCNNSNWQSICGCHHCGCGCGCTGWTPYGTTQASAAETSACGCGSSAAIATGWPACAVDWSGFLSETSGCGCNG